MNRLIFRSISFILVLTILITAYPAGAGAFSIGYNQPNTGFTTNADPTLFEETALAHRAFSALDFFFKLPTSFSKLLKSPQLPLAPDASQIFRDSFGPATNDVLEFLGLSEEHLNQLENYSSTLESTFQFKPVSRHTLILRRGRTRQAIEFWTAQFLPPVRTLEMAENELMLTNIAHRRQRGPKAKLIFINAVPTLLQSPAPGAIAATLGLGNEATLIEFSKALAEALADIHGENITHGDLHSYLDPAASVHTPAMINLSNIFVYRAEGKLDVSFVDFEFGKQEATLKQREKERRQVASALANYLAYSSAFAAMPPESKRPMIAATQQAFQEAYRHVSSRPSTSSLIAPERLERIIATELLQAQREFVERNLEKHREFTRPLPEPLKPGQRVIAIGDIHGHLRGLLVILLAEGLIDGRGNWKGGRRTLVQLGDIIAEGPFSLEAYAYLLRLQRQALRNGGDAIIQIGNRDMRPLQNEYARNLSGEDYFHFRTDLIQRIQNGEIGLASQFGGMLFVHSIVLPKRARIRMPDGTEKALTLTEFVHYANDALRQAAFSREPHPFYRHPLFREDGIVRYFPKKEIREEDVAYPSVIGHLQNMTGGKVTPLAGGKVIVTDVGLAKNRGYVTLEDGELSAYSLLPHQGGAIKDFFRSSAPGKRRTSKLLSQSV